MAFDWSVRQSGVWHRVTTPYVRVAGVWKGIYYAWVYDAGAWRLMHAYQPAAFSVGGVSSFSCTDPGCATTHAFSPSFSLGSGGRNTNIVWTIDGSTPVHGSAPYEVAGVTYTWTNGLTLSRNQSVVVSARAYDTRSGYYSNLSQLTFVYHYTPATGTAPGTPTIVWSPGGTTFFSCSLRQQGGGGCPLTVSWTVTLTSSGTAPVTQHYTTDGSTPTTASTALANGGSFTLTINRPTIGSIVSKTVKAMAHNAYGSSAVASHTFSYEYTA